MLNWSSCTRNWSSFCGHTLSNNGNRYDSEIESDKYAGFILYKLGASLNETKQSYSNLPEKGSSTHPPKSVRINALISGWYDAKRNGEQVVESERLKIEEREKEKEKKETYKKTYKKNQWYSVGLDMGTIYRVEKNKIYIFLDYTVDFGKTHISFDEAYEFSKVQSEYGWHLPDANEMHLINSSRVLFNTADEFFWSSTTSKNNNCNYVYVMNFAKQSYDYFCSNEKAKIILIKEIDI